MPGITGIISKKQTSGNIRDLRLMVDSLMHESFYTSGNYTNDKMGLHVGWVNHRNSFSDCMPVYNEEKNVILFYSGEDFANDALTDRLRAQGHKFDQLNASYLIHLYEEQGDGFFRELNGWFAGFLIDLRTQKAFLFNDRYGMHRIYYHESKDELLFSSEAKSLLRVRPELKKLDMESLGQFFCCGTTLGSKSLFSDISILPGGSAWIFDKDRGTSKKQYFMPNEWENQPELDKTSFYEELKEAFQKIVPRYFTSKNRVGMSLTGGLDTRMIMAWKDGKLGDFPCYTFGGMYRDCFDVKIARKIAAVCHQPYEVIPVGRKFLDDFPSFAERTIYITDGCLDVCGASEVYVNRLARDIAPIRMTGNYGSEVLRSVNYIKANPPDARLFTPDFQALVVKAEKTFGEADGGRQLSNALFKLIPRHLYGRFASARSQITLRTPYMDNELVSLFYRAPEEVRKSREISLRLIADGNPVLSRIRTDRGVGGSSNFLVSKSSRVYHEVLFKLEYYYNTGMPQWLAQVNNAFRPLPVEKLILGRHKIDHYRVWFRDELSQYVKDILLDDRTAQRPYFNRKFLKEMVRDHVKGSHNYTEAISAALTAELIQRHLVE